MHNSNSSGSITNICQYWYTCYICLSILQNITSITLSTRTLPQAVSMSLMNSIFTNTLYITAQIYPCPFMNFPGRTRLSIARLFCQNIFGIAVLFPNFFLMCIKTICTSFLYPTTTWWCTLQNINIILGSLTVMWKCVNIIIIIITVPVWLLQS